MQKIFVNTQRTLREECLKEFQTCSSDWGTVTNSLTFTQQLEADNNKCKKVRKEIAFEGEKMFGEEYLVET